MMLIWMWNDLLKHIPTLNEKVGKLIIIYLIIKMYSEEDIQEMFKGKNLKRFV